MTYLLIVIAIAFSALMLFQIFAPFLSSRQEQLRFELLDEDLRRIEALVSRKVALVQTLRDLEYDFETAKITEEDYRKFKRSCERQAVAVMRRLDAIHGGRDWEVVIEKALQEKLEAQDEVVAPKEPSAETAPSTCSHCEAPLKDDDRFCSKCGASVTSSPESPSSETPTAEEAVAPGADDPALSSHAAELSPSPALSR